MEVEEDLELENTDWIEEIKKENELYKHFYKEVNESINVSFIYVNKNNDIYYVKNMNFPLEEGVLKKEDLLFLLKKHNVYNSLKHQILSILQYNINLEPSDLLSFLKSSPKENDYLKVKDGLNDIKYNDSITLLEDLNSLYVVYYEIGKKRRNTRKIYLNKFKLKSKKGTRKRI